jgi:hypothetical protein
MAHALAPLQLKIDYVDFASHRWLDCMRDLLDDSSVLVVDSSQGRFLARTATIPVPDSPSRLDSDVDCYRGDHRTVARRSPL